MNVRMPNGQIISNVPEGTTKKELAIKLNNSSAFTGDKIDVALLIEGKPGDPKSGLGSWTDAKGKEKFLTKIDDSEASIKNKRVAKFIYNKKFRDSFKVKEVSGKLGELMNHDKLYNHSPYTKDINVKIITDMSDSHPAVKKAGAYFQYQYDPLGKIESIVFNAENFSNDYSTEEDVLSILLHEVQHKLQYDAVVSDKDKGKVQNYYKAKPEKGKVKGYQKAETYFDAEPLAEVVQDMRASSKGQAYEIPLDQNYLVTQHAKRFARKDPDNVLGERMSLSTTNFPPYNTGEQAAMKKLDDYMEEIAQVETGGGILNKKRNIRANIDPKTGKPKSSAEGFFQFLTRDNEGKPGTNSSLQTAINRTKKYFGNRKIDWMDETYKSGDVMSLSYDQQKLLAIGNLMEKEGSDELWIKFFKAKTPNELAQAKRDIYSKLHHTDTEGKDAKDIAKNMNKIESWRIK